MTIFSKNLLHLRLFCVLPILKKGYSYKASKWLLWLDSQAAKRVEEKDWMLCTTNGIVNSQPKSDHWCNSSTQSPTSLGSNILETSKQPTFCLKPHWAVHGGRCLPNPRFPMCKDIVSSTTWKFDLRGRGVGRQRSIAAVTPRSSCLLFWMLFSTSTKIISLIEASTSTTMLSQCKVQEEVVVELSLTLRDFALVFNPFLSPSFHLR